MSPDDFESAVLGAFQYLISDFGFCYLSTRVHMPECWSTFHNQTTSVVVHYEAGSPPWVVLARLEVIRDRTEVRDQAALAFLVHERSQNVSIPERPLNDEDLRRMIDLNARQLREYGEDVLRGDFRIFPRLEELAAENLRRRNASEPYSS